MKATPTQLRTVATRLEKPHSDFVDKGAALLLREAAEDYEKLRLAFDALLLGEIDAYGGVPLYQGRCAKENNDLRQTIAGLLDDGGEVREFITGVLDGRR